MASGRWVQSGRISGADVWGRWMVIVGSDVRFRQVPAGEYGVGLSDHELRVALRVDAAPQWTINEITPVVTVHVEEVWVAELPVSCAFARDAGLLVDGDDSEPALLTFDEVEHLSKEYGWRPLTEAEWETCCRGGQQSLFVWGDELPDRDVLESWLSWKMAGEGSPRNAWGFGSLFFGEWCGDPFRSGRGIQAAVGETGRVIKGGGAQFWPWQTNHEWVWCASAMRMPSTDLFADGRAAFRPCLQMVDSLAEPDA